MVGQGAGQRASLASRSAPLRKNLCRCRKYVTAAQCGLTRPPRQNEDGGDIGICARLRYGSLCFLLNSTLSGCQRPAQDTTHRPHDGDQGKSQCQVLCEAFHIKTFQTHITFKYNTLNWEFKSRRAEKCHFQPTSLSFSWRLIRFMCHSRLMASCFVAQLSA